jgi:hypothetical protein
LRATKKLKDRCHPEEGESPPRDRTMSRTIDAVDKIVTQHPPRGFLSSRSALSADFSQVADDPLGNLGGRSPASAV